MHSRDPREIHRLIHLVMQTGPTEPRAALLCHSLQQQLAAIDAAAMGGMHGSQLSHTDKENLHLILQASLTDTDLLSWWGRFARLTLPGIDVRLHIEKKDACVSIHCEQLGGLPDALARPLNQYLVAYTESRLTHGLMELGFLDTNRRVSASSENRYPLPGNPERKGSIPAVRARQQCHKALALLPGSEHDLGVAISNWIEKQALVPCIDDCAEAFKTSARTLNRKLAMIGIRYNGLQEQHRSFRALQGLQEQERPIWQIAEDLGYDNQANFGRACRRWFGQSPKVLKEMLNPPLQQELRW